MKLALLGYPIAHSLSPEIYRKLLGDQLESYQLLEIKDSSDVPKLTELRKNFSGLNITAPYKKHFMDMVEIKSESVKELGAINTISFSGNIAQATNTDLIATETILLRFQRQYPHLQVILLGNGSMASLTTLLATKHRIPLVQKSRSSGVDLSTLDLSSFHRDGIQTIVINSCSRSFVFKGLLHSQFIFWDFNYRFDPHKTTLPGKVLTYYDGQEMLELQALAAVEFWKGNKA